MEFCKCGKLLTRKGEKFVCASCGYEKEIVNLFHSEKMAEKKKIPVIEKEVSALPEVKEECPKCRNDRAYFWQVQTRGADESPTSFFKCTKCKHTWREYT